MTEAALRESKDALSARQRQILSAAERCFVNAGFHRTTMQDIARAAAMSSPNIYRYFDSKQAIVIAIGERERVVAADFIAKLDAEGDPRSALMAIVARHYLDMSRASAIMRLEIWAEATRNPAIADTMTQMEEQRRTWIVERLASLGPSPPCDPVALFEAINALLKGLVVSVALVPGFDQTGIVAQVEALIGSGLEDGA